VVAEAVLAQLLPLEEVAVEEQERAVGPTQFLVQIIPDQEAAEEEHHRAETAVPALSYCQYPKPTPRRFPLA
jgi:hypothetical protein